VNQCVFSLLRSSNQCKNVVGLTTENKISGISLTTRKKTNVISVRSLFMLYTLISSYPVNNLCVCVLKIFRGKMFTR